MESLGKSIALAAPTGRAAQRLGEITRLEAKTIHRREVIYDYADLNELAVFLER